MLYRSVEKSAYYHAYNRCNCKSDIMYHRYGGRGIQFKYKSFTEFITDVGLRPSRKHTLDRINNDGHYEPGNCRWATKSEQAINRAARIEALDVWKIRRMYVLGYSQDYIADIFDVGQPYISRILNGKRRSSCRIKS